MDKNSLGFIQKFNEIVPVVLDPKDLALKDKRVSHRKSDKEKKFSFRYDATSVVKKLTSAYKIRYRLKKRIYKSEQHKDPAVRTAFRDHKNVCEVKLKIPAFKIELKIYKTSFNEAMRTLAFRLHKIYVSKIIKA